MIFDGIWVQLNTIIPYVALLSFFVTIATLIANILATIKNTKAKEADSLSNYMKVLKNMMM